MRPHKHVPCTPSNYLGLPNFFFSFFLLFFWCFFREKLCHWPISPFATYKIVFSKPWSQYLCLKWISPHLFTPLKQIPPTPDHRGAASLRWSSGYKNLGFIGNHSINNGRKEEEGRQVHKTLKTWPWVVKQFSCAVILSKSSISKQMLRWRWRGLLRCSAWYLQFKDWLV